MPSPAIACATACTSCAATTIPGAEEYEPGRHLDIIHIGHVADLEQQGWTVYSNGIYDDGQLDVVCPHMPEPEA
jgi:hypothetical protein